MTNAFTPQIGFIGAGRAGCSLGRYFADKGLKVMGYYSKTPDSAQEAASFTDTAYYADISSLVKESNIIFITVPDSQIECVWHEVACNDIKGKIICHTSGALSSNVFSNIAGLLGYGYSLHPLCAISSKTESYKDLYKTYFTIEGSKEMLDVMISIVKSLGNKITAIDAADKVKYHAAAVFASNLVCGLFSEACGILEACGFEENEAREALAPLFLGNSMSVAHKGAEKALTGPVDRNDITTVKKHLAALTDEQREIYRLLSAYLTKIAKKKNPETDYTELIGVLSADS